MGQRRKKRYKSKPNPHPPLFLTGRAYLKYWEAFRPDGAFEVGDMEFFLFSDTMGREEDDPGYDHIGGSGYLKARVYDGKEWQPLVMDDLFPQRQHHFNKSEMPHDTFVVCKEYAETELKGLKLQRGYRMHYEPAPDETEKDD